MASEHRHRTEVSGGVRLYWTQAGSGPPLVLLHGFPETSHAWRRVVPALSEHFTVVAPDLRGCGDSDRPQGGYDKRTVAGDVHELVHQLGFERIRLVSHDVGMMVGYAYACASWRRRSPGWDWRTCTTPPGTRGCTTCRCSRLRTRSPRR